MNIIAISGPHGAGKDTMIELVLAELNKEFPGRISQANFYRTRPLRTGEEQNLNALYCSEQGFDRMLKNNEFAFFDKAYDPMVGPYRVGTTWKELEKNDYIVTNLSDKCALELKEKVSGSEDRTYLIFLHAPKETRIGRMQFRESWLFPERFEEKLENDPTDPNPERHRNFDLVIENKENQAEAVAQEIISHIREFIREKEIKNEEIR